MKNIYIILLLIFTSCSITYNTTYTDYIYYRPSKDVTKNIIDAPKEKIQVTNNYYPDDDSYFSYEKRIRIFYYNDYWYYTPLEYHYWYRDYHWNYYHNDIYNHYNHNYHHDYINFNYNNYNNSIQSRKNISQAPTNVPTRNHNEYNKSNYSQPKNQPHTYTRPSINRSQPFNPQPRNSQPRTYSQSTRSSQSIRTSPTRNSSGRR